MEKAYCGALNGASGAVITSSGGTPMLTAGDSTDSVFSGAMNDGSGVVSFTKSGSGKLTFNAANSNTGGTTVNQGTLVLNTGGQVGAIRGTLTINQGATLHAPVPNGLGYGVGTKVDNVNISGGLLDASANDDQGWGVAYVLTAGTMQTNGGVSSSATNSKFAFGGPAGANTSVTTLASATSSLISGKVDLRNDNGDNTSSPVVFTVADGMLQSTCSSLLRLRGTIRPRTNPRRAS